MFSCAVKPDDSCADFSWRHMQTGSRNPPKAEVVITGKREDISTWSQWLRHSFRARPIHFHLRRHCTTMRNSIRYKPEVETVAQTRSTNNLATENRYRRNLNGYTNVLEGNFCHWFICQPHATLPSPWNSRWWTHSGSSYSLATENDIKVISVAAAMFSDTPSPLPPASIPHDYGEQHQVQTGSRNSTPNRNY